MTTPTNIADSILAPELANQLIVARDIEVGDLCVVTDYKGREVGARVTHIMGETIVGKVCGLDAPRPYVVGDSIPRDRQYWRRAV